MTQERLTPQEAFQYASSMNGTEGPTGGTGSPEVSQTTVENALREAMPGLKALAEKRGQTLEDLFAHKNPLLMENLAELLQGDMEGAPGEGMTNREFMRAASRAEEKKMEERDRQQKRDPKAELKKIAEEAESSTVSSEQLTKMGKTVVSLEKIFYGRAKRKYDEDLLRVKQEIKDKGETPELKNRRLQIEADFQRDFKVIDDLRENIEKNKDTPRAAASDIATLARILNNYVQNPEKKFGQFELPKDFRELAWFIADAEDKRYQPGGEYQVIEITPEGKEVLHEENITRLVMEKILYIANQNPYSPVNPLQELQISHPFSPLSWGRIINDDQFWLENESETRYERHFLSPEEYEKNKDNEQVKDDIQIDEVTGKYFFWQPVEFAESRKKSDRLQALRDEILFKMFLFQYRQNTFCSYFNDWMKSEKPLAEGMAQACNANALTRFMGRELREASINAYHNGGEDPDYKEFEDLLTHDGTMQKGGSMGQGRRRAHAAFYLIGEATARANNWTLERDRNTAREALRSTFKDKAGNPEQVVEGMDLLYVSLIRQSLEKNFGGELLAAKDLITALNSEDVLIPGTQKKRKRYEWEKVDVADLLFLNKKDLQARLAELNMSEQQYKDVRQKIEDNYSSGKSADGTRMLDIKTNEPQKRRAQLDEIGQESPSSAEVLIKLFEKIAFSDMGKKLGYTDEKKDKDGNVVKDANGEAIWVMTGFMKNFVKALGENGGGALFLKDTRNNRAVQVQLEIFANKFFTKPNDPGSTVDMNFYRNINYEESAKGIVKKAIQDMLIHTERLDRTEAEWAEKCSFYESYFMGASARNDFGSPGEWSNGPIGHDAGSKPRNMSGYKVRQALSGGNFYGMEDLIYGIHRINVDMYEGLKVRFADQNSYNTTVLELILGITQQNGDISINLDKKLDNFELQGNAMRQYYGDHYANSLKLFELLNTPEPFPLAKFITEDAAGRIIVNHVELQKFINDTWKALRYALDNRGFLYDKVLPEWRLEQEIIIMNGQAVSKAKPVFGVSTLRDSMISKEVQHLHMYQNRPDIGTLKNKEDLGEANKIARTVMAYIIAMQLKSHTREGNARWGPEAMERVVDAFLRYGVGVFQGNDETAEFIRSFFTTEEVEKIMQQAGILLTLMYAKSYGIDSLGGFVSGLMDFVGFTLKSIGSGIKL